MKWLAATLDPIVTTEDVKVVPHATFESTPDVDILFVPGGGPAVAQVMNDPVHVEYVRSAGSRAQYAGSVCTGAFIVAAAGLFDGHEATTYWSRRHQARLVR